METLLIWLWLINFSQFPDCIEFLEIVNIVRLSSLRSQFMKCASPLCQQKSKKTTTLKKVIGFANAESCFDFISLDMHDLISHRISFSTLVWLSNILHVCEWQINVVILQFFLQTSRTTFLNRSTAASRSRRTPGLASPSVGSRTRAALFSATTFNPMMSKPHLSTPSRHGNLSTDVQSFIKRNTPQKPMSFRVSVAAGFFAVVRVIVMIKFCVGATSCKGRTA